MASSSVYEGDVIFLYCKEARGYVYSDPPGSKFSRVTVFTPESTAPTEDPGFPNVHFAAFQILPSNAKAEPGTLRRYKGKDAFARSLVYGRKIKLLHMASRKYLSFASPNEGVHSTAFLVDWKKEQDDECLLRVLPAQTGIRRQRGEDVLPGDTIRLECVMPTGHHVLCMENAVTSRYEVKRAVTDSVFTVHMHISWHEKIPLRAIRGASVVLIHNLENEVYLSGEGSLASKFLGSKEDQQEEPSQPSLTSIPSWDPPATQPTLEAMESVVSISTRVAVLEDSIAMDLTVTSSKEVVARKPRNIHGFQRIAQCGDIFWQLEDFKHPMNGDWIEFGKPYRIKHVPSQRYLAVVYKDDKPHHLTLIDQCSSLVSSPDVAFRLIQTAKREKRLTKVSYVEIRHGLGEHERSLKINTHSHNSRQMSRATSSEDDATALDVEQFDRVYGLSLVDPDDVKLVKRQLLFKIEEVRPNLVQQFYHILGVTKTLMSYAQKCVSDESSGFLENSKEAKDMVKAFGNWVKMGQNSQIRAEMFRIAKAPDVMMALLRILDTDKLKDFRRLLCVALEGFVTVGGKRCRFYLAKVEHIDLLLEMVGSGIKVENILSALAKDELKVTELLVRRLIQSEFLKSMLDNKRLDAPPLNLLSSLCFSEGRPVRKLQAIILQSVIEKGKSSLLRTKVDPEAGVVISTPKRLAGKTLTSLDRKPQNILVAQIKLFSRVCKGVNKVSIRTIVEDYKLVTIEEAFLCINNDHLQPALRSAYIDFIISTLVDVNVEESGTTVENIWNTFNWNDLPFNPMKAVGNVFNIIPNGKQIEQLQETIMDFLSSCTPLQAQEEVEGTNEMVVQMLNAMKPLVAYGFYWDPSVVLNIVRVLISLIDSDPKQFVCNNDGKVKPKDEKNQLLFQLKTKAVNILYLFFVQLSYMALCKMVYDYGHLKRNEKCQDDRDYVDPSKELMELTLSNVKYSEVAPLARKRLEYYLEEKGYDMFRNLVCGENRFIQSLIDLMQFEDDDLRISSCKLLFAIYHAEKTLFSKAKVSYIYTENSWPTHEKMVNLATFADKDKVLLRMLQGHAESGENLDRAMETLNDLLEDFIIDGKDTQPNTINQNIAYSTGLVSVLMEYVSFYCKETSGEQTELVAKACLVLQRAARGNKKVQAKLFESYVDLLDVQIAPSAVAKLLTEVFTNNEELCRNVTESELSLIFHIASTGESHDELFTTLQAIIKCGKSLPLLMPKFQDVVAKLFLESLHDSFSFLLVPGNREACHLEILKRPDPDNACLVKMLNVCNLLSICSEGEKKFPENVCQAVFSLEELVKILEDDAISIERKTSFTSLLTEVYLISDRESLTAISTLAKDRSFWSHAEFAAQLMSCMADTIQNNFTVEPTEIQPLLHYLSHRHLSLRTWKELSAGIETTVVCGSQEKPLTSILFYIMEGFLPMITAFCDQLEEANMADVNSKLIRELLNARSLSVLKAIGDGVVALANQKKIFDFSKPHIHLMIRCLGSLLFLVPSSEWPSLREARTTLLQRDAQEDSSHHSEFNEATLKEVKVNQSFTQFVENYEQAYLCREEQDEARSADSMTGGELVLSDPSFMALIQCFTCEVDTKLRIKELGDMLKFLDVLYKMLQQPLTYRNRSSLDGILYTCLKLLSGVVYFYTTKRSIAQGTIIKRDISDSEHEELVKTLQDELVTIKGQGAHESVINHLTHPQDKVAVQAIAFLTALIFNGNEKAQLKIGQCLSTKDTELFTRIEAILDSASSCLKADPLGRIRRTASAVPERPHEETSVTPDETQETALNHLESTLSTNRDPVRQRKSVWQLEVKTAETKQHVMVVLDLVAAMCDGQRMENQELFREQESQFNSVNIVSQIAVLLQAVAEPLTDEHIPIARKAIQALIELCAGNFANQQTAFKAQIVDTVNSILRKKDTGSSECKELLELKSAGLELLNVLLEETSSESFDLLQGISQDIATDTVLDAMLDLWDTYQEDSTREDAQKGMFDAFHILKKIADNLRQPVKKYVDFDEKANDADKDKAAKLQKMWDGVEMWSRSIEVVYHTEEQKQILTRVYFPFNPENGMNEETKDFVGGKIKRSSPEDKVKDLLEWMTAVYDRMKYKKFVKHTPWLYWTEFLSGPRRFLLIFLTLLLNLLTIIFFKIPANEVVDDHNSTVFIVTPRILDLPLGYYVTLYLLGSVHLILAFWMVIEYYVSVKQNLSFRLTYVEELLWEIKKWMGHNSLNTGLSSKELLDYIQRPKEQECFDVFFFGFGPIYRILFVCFSVLSLGFSGYWYSGCLLYLFLNIVVLDQVLTALKRSALQLLIVFLLGLSILFMYSVVSFAFLHGYFDPGESLFCETLAQCFSTVTREGLLDTLGGAIPLQITNPDGSVVVARYGSRAVFDLTFFIIVTTIGLNIVVAILVDTFSELREQRDAINEDKKNFCFICGIENDEFERKAEGFQEHITKDHHMWNYIYFYLHLRKVNQCDHNAMEKYVYEQIKNKSIQFFPLRKAKILIGTDQTNSSKNGGSAAASRQKDGSGSAGGN